MSCFPTVYPTPEPHTVGIAAPSTNDGDDPERYQLYRDTRRLLAAGRAKEAVRTLEQDIHLHVAEYARAHVFVHAGVVGWQGRALVFPSRSFADKSTLVVRLLAAGASYYSDEYAALDDRGWVHPFPRPLSLRTEERARRLPYTAFGATRGVEPLPVSAVVMTSYRHGAGAVQAHDLRLPPPRAGTPGAPAGDAARTHAGRASAPALCYMNVRKTA